MASSLIEKGSRGLLYWVCSLTSIERSEGQGKRGGWEVKVCKREKEEEMDEVSFTTLAQGTSGGCHPFGEH